MAARSIWKGALSVGLVQVGVAAYKATDDATDATRKKWLHAGCLTPIGQKKTCVTCGVAELALSDIVDGVEQADGRFVLVTKDEIAAIKAPSSDTIAVEAFVPAADIDAIYIASTYYVGPSTPTPAFALLREAMRARGVVMTGRVSLYGREHQVALRPLGQVLAMHLLRTDEDVRATEEIPGFANLSAPVDPAQLALADQLLALYAGTFDPMAYEDQYVKAFHALVAAKAAGTPVPVVPTTAQPAPMDVMEALKRSLAAVPATVVKIPKATKAKAAKPGKKAQAA